MYFELWTGSDVAQMRLERAEKNAAWNWRFRNLRTRESQALAAIVSNVLGLFLR